MGFRSAITNDKGQLVGGWAKIWKVFDVTNGTTITFNNGKSVTYPPGNYSIAQVSTFKKNQDGTYETDFQNNFVRLIGKAHQIGKDIGHPEKPVSIQILNSDVTSRYDRDKNTEYINFVIYDFAMNNTSTPKNATPKKKDDSFINIPDGIDEELPFN